MANAHGLKHYLVNKSKIEAEIKANEEEITRLKRVNNQLGGDAKKMEAKICAIKKK